MIKKEILKKYKIKISIGIIMLAVLFFLNENIVY